MILQQINLGRQMSDEEEKLHPRLIKGKKGLQSWFLGCWGVWGTPPARAGAEKAQQICRENTTKCRGLKFKKKKLITPVNTHVRKINKLLFNILTARGRLTSPTPEVTDIILAHLAQASVHEQTMHWKSRAVKEGFWGRWHLSLVTSKEGTMGMSNRTNSTAGRRKNHFVGMDASGKWSWKGRRLSLDQTKNGPLDVRGLKIVKKPSSFWLPVEPYQLSQGLRRADILHCIAFK